MTYSEEQLKQCTLNAVDGAFCDEKTKEMLMLHWEYKCLKALIVKQEL